MVSKVKQYKKLQDELSDEGKQHLYKKLLYLKFANDPVAWAEYKGLELNDYQKATLAACVEDKPICRVSSRAPRGAGKTFISAVLVVWFIDVNETLGIGWQCMTTAPVFEQLQDFLWPEIHKVASMIEGLDTSKDVLLDTRYKGKYGRATSRTVSPNNSGTIEGMHKDRVLVVVEEMKSVDNRVLDSLEGSFSQAGVGDRKAIIYGPSTPGAKAGYFYEIHTGKLPSWTAIHITIEEAIASGRIAESWVEERRIEWGEDSVLWYNHVLAQFAADDATALINTSVLRRSANRWHDLMNNPEIRAEIEHGSLQIGLDPSSKGRDETVAYFYNKDHNIIWKSEYEAVTRNVASLGHRYAIKYPHAYLVIDSIGEGSGTRGAASQVERPGGIYEFKSNRSSKWRTKTGSRVKNERAQAYYNIVQMLNDPDNQLAIPDEEKLWADLQAPEPIYMANDVINITSKKDLKPVLGRSPDHGDAAVMAVFERYGKKRKPAKSWDYKRSALA